MESKIHSFPFSRWHSFFLFAFFVEKTFLPIPCVTSQIEKKNFKKRRGVGVILSEVDISF